MKNNNEFLMLTILNNGTETLEYDTTINGEFCSVRYFKSTDAVLIIFWCDYFGDELKFVRTAYFDSFLDWVESNEKLISYTDHWDYSNESVYQEYQKQDFDEWLDYEGESELKTFVEDQLKTHGIKYVKRSLINRFKRGKKKLRMWVSGIIVELKNISK